MFSQVIQVGNGSIWLLPPTQNNALVLTAVLGDMARLRPIGAAGEVAMPESLSVHSTGPPTATNTVSPSESEKPDPRSVAVVHGRNEDARLAIFEFLRSLKLHPKEWSEVLAQTGKGTPVIAEALDALFHRVQAVVVLLTGDDIARIGTRYLKQDDPTDERNLTPRRARTCYSKLVWRLAGIRIGPS